MTPAQAAVLGGKARAKKLSARRRTQIARLAAKARWAKRWDGFVYNGPAVAVAAQSSRSAVTSFPTPEPSK